jgi:hypothetical protein
MQDPSFTTPEGVAALLDSNAKGVLAVKLERRRGLKQKVDLADIFQGVLREIHGLPAEGDVA